MAREKQEEFGGMPVKNEPSEWEKANMRLSKAVARLQDAELELRNARAEEKRARAELGRLPWSGER